jgi:hypothetical protein
VSAKFLNVLGLTTVLFMGQENTARGDGLSGQLKGGVTLSCIGGNINCHPSALSARPAQRHDISSNLHQPYIVQPPGIIPQGQPPGIIPRGQLPGIIPNGTTSRDNDQPLLHENYRYGDARRRPCSSLDQDCRSGNRAVDPRHRHYPYLDHNFHYRSPGLYDAYPEFLYRQPYDYDYSTYNYASGRTSCRAARQVLLGAGYRIIKVISCGGKYHRFSAQRRGHAYKLRVNAVTGRILVSARLN